MKLKSIKFRYYSRKYKADARCEPSKPMVCHLSMLKLELDPSEWDQRLQTERLDADEKPLIRNAKM